jgi:hypothetical protein
MLNKIQKREAISLNRNHVIPIYFRAKLSAIRWRLDENIFLTIGHFIKDTGKLGPVKNATIKPRNFPDSATWVSSSYPAP